jgi:guanylate kinase
MNTGFLLIIDGPSAVGKSTILEALLEQQDMPLEVARRVTTRAKRDNDDETYIFISHEEYDRMVECGELLEHHCYLFGMCYGLPKQIVEDNLAEGKNIIGMINLGNFPKVKAQIPNSFGVFIHASIDTIRERLESRGSHNVEQIEERLGNARKGLEYQKTYDVIVTNENRSVESTVQEILSQFKNFIIAHNNQL